MTEFSKPYFVAPHIRYAWIEDRVIILDLQSEAYFALDPTASFMWQQLGLGHGREQSVQNLREKYSTQSHRVEEDFAAFVRRCADSGWLVDEPPPQPAGPMRLSTDGGQVRRISTIGAWWTLYRTTRSLSVRGFSATYAALSETAQLEESRKPNRDETLSAAVKAFARAEEFFHLKNAPADCLPRSLALFRFLRLVGVPAEHCIGVGIFPFSAHAWTQCQGRIIHDEQFDREQYTIIARIPR